MEKVLLLHGLGGQGWMMRPLAAELRKQGFSTAIWSYQSFRRSINSHAQKLQSLVCDLSREHDRLHVVGHSMGGILIRAAVNGISLPNAGRMVMLGPPNAGSAVARHFAKWVNFLCPALGELSDQPDSLVNRLPSSTLFETGVIAARFDNVVSRQSTHLPGERDHTVVSCRHGMLPFSKSAIEQTVFFLNNGLFTASETAARNQAISPLPTGF